MKRSTTIGALVLVWGVVGVGLAERAGLLEAAKTPLYRVKPAGPTVLFVVLDTVRSDHLSACGYERPTSPTLSALAKEGSLSCGAVAPGSWTFPSHASLFTGVDPSIHGAHFSPTGTDVRKLIVAPLSPAWPTLAEQLVALGHQAHGLSGNPVVSEVAGLTRGFESFATAPTFGPWYGEGFIRQLRTLLRGLEPDRPLFLFLNIADAHDPWEPVPGGLDHADPEPEGLQYFLIDEATGQIEHGPWSQYVLSELSPEAEEALRTRVTNLYDHGLHAADATLGRALEELGSHGWLDQGVRIVLTSDHGEFLGEHQLLRHGRYLWEENQRVPLLIVDRTGNPVPELPPVVSGLEAHWLVRDGARPAQPPPVLAAAWPDTTWAELSRGTVGVHTSASMWTGDAKITWMDGELQLYDLASDPLELAPLDLEGATPPELRALIERVQRTRPSEDLDPELLEALQAAGYVDTP